MIFGLGTATGHYVHQFYGKALLVIPILEIVDGRID
jgi:hypothetical protein